MRLLPYLLYLFVVAFHETILRDATSIADITINLPALIVLTVALHKSELVSAWFGFCTGVLIGALAPATMGWGALAMAALALGTSHAKVRLNLDSIYARLSVLAGGVLLHNVVEVVLTQPGALGYQLWRTCLPGTVYSLLIAFVLFVIIEGAVTLKTIRALF